MTNVHIVPPAYVPYLDEVVVLPLGTDVHLPHGRSSILTSASAMVDCAASGMHGRCGDLSVQELSSTPSSRVAARWQLQRDIKLTPMGRCMPLPSPTIPPRTHESCPTGRVISFPITLGAWLSRRTRFGF